MKIRKFHFEKSANFLTLFCIVPLRSTLQYLDCGAPTPPLMGMGGDRCTSLMKDKKPRKMNFPALFFYSKLAAYDENLAMLLTTHITEPIQHIVEAWSWLSFHGGFHGLMIHGHIFTAPFLLLLYILSENLYRTCLNICANLTN